MNDQILYDAWGRAVRPLNRHRASNFHAISNGYPDPYNYSGGQGGQGADLHRARSHGHGPVPNIHIYNDVVQENIDNPPVIAPRGRPTHRHGDLLPEVAAGGGGGGHWLPPHVADSGRSKSRGSMSPGAWDREVRMAKFLQREEEEEAKRREEAAIADFKRRQEEESRERKDIIRQAIFDAEEKKRKDKEKKEEILRQAKIEEEQRQEKEKKEWEEFERRQKEKAAKEKAREEKEWEEFERRQKEKAAKEKAKEEKEKADYQEKVRKDFAKFGLSENQIEHMINPDKEKEKDKKSSSRHRRSTSGALVLAGKHSSSHLERPTYPKIHRHDIATETLQYYNLSWEYDRHDPDYIIVLHEMNVRETDILFEHTRRLKSKKLIDDGKGKKKDGVEWVVKRSKSRGKSRERSRSGVRERFAGNLVKHL